MPTPDDFTWLSEIDFRTEAATIHAAAGSTASSGGYWANLRANEVRITGSEGGRRLELTVPAGGTQTGLITPNDAEDKAALQAFWWEAIPSENADFDLFRMD